MAVKHTIEEIFDLDEPYEPSYEVLRDRETLGKELEALEDAERGDGDGN